MKKTILMVSMLAFATYSHAAAKPCEELKEEIAAKIESKGVQNYTLKIVPIDAEEEGREVGTCDGGTKKIIYIRG
ncbi:MAG: DUF1161 domain-containing protein [Nitrosomonadales bacterium]|nr:DUF1161 domain-containing protein [Nitrosomonadales bacterium]